MRNPLQFGNNQFVCSTPVRAKRPTLWPRETIEPLENRIAPAAAFSGFDIDGVCESQISASDVILQNNYTAVSVSVSPASVSEGSAAGLVYTFTRTGDTSAPLTVNF